MKMAEIDAGLREVESLYREEEKRDIGGFTIVFI